MKVGVADLKAHLSEHLRRVRRGETPYETKSAGIVIHPPRRPGRLQDVKLPPPVDLGGLDPVEILLELRKDRF